MISVLAAHREELGRVEPGKSPEIANEVCLVKIAACLRDRRPCHLALPLDLSEHLLKPLDTAEELRREPDFGAKCLDEPPPAETDPVRDFADTPDGRAAQ